MVIYADVLVVLNFFVTYLLLLCAKKIAGQHGNNKRLLLGALIGGFYALTLFLPPIKTILAYSAYFLVSLLIIFVSFPMQNAKKFLRTFAAFVLANFFFAGLMFFIFWKFSPEGMLYQNGSVYFDIDVKILVIASSICFILLESITYLLRRKAPDNCYYSIILRNKNTKVEAIALYDTGNTLKDAFSSLPVVIAEPKTFQATLGRTADELFGQMVCAENENLRFIPYTDISNSGVLKAIKIDSIEIPEKKIYIQPVLLAESVSPFANKEYNVLITNDFFERSNTHVHHKNSI